MKKKKEKKEREKKKTLVYIIRIGTEKKKIKEKLREHYSRLSVTF